jgi:UPF0755 protein
MKFFYIFLAIIVIGLLFVYSLFKAPAEFKEDKSFLIEPGRSAQVVALNLQEQGLIKNALLFRLTAKFKGAEKNLVSGEHQLSAGSGVLAIISQLQNKDNLSSELTITIPEGWRMYQIAEHLENKGIATIAEFNQTAKIENWREQYDFLADKSIKSLEGYLFPDTYRIFSDAKPDDVIKRMLDNFSLKLDDKLQSDIVKSGKSLHEIIILASIIEHEAKFDTDRYLVAGVFYNRLEIGMALQSCATINYLTNKNAARVSGEDLEIDSPYNTYKNRGLPPGPIANPGLESIKSAIYPQSGNYFYFLNDSSGKAYFAETYEKHQANIRKYLD